MNAKRSLTRSTLVALLLVPLLWAGLGRPAAALVVVPPGSNNNTSAPSDDPGWLNVGDNGVYLGNRWVITAFHVGAQTTTFPGIPGSFDVVPGSAVQLQNPTGFNLSTNTDLLMYRLTTDPGLPSLAIATSTPAQGSTITFIGDGLSVMPDATETRWDALWNVSPGGINGGYVSGGSRKLWGTNKVENDGAVVVNDNIADVISFFTKFDDPAAMGSTATSSETQAQSGDSGSAAFEKIGDQWVLAGITFAVGADDVNQPDPRSNAIYGNDTFAADLSQYRIQILSIVPEANGFALLSVIALLAGGWKIASFRRRGQTHIASR
jgi:hypothetical protein